MAYVTSEVMAARWRMTSRNVQRLLADGRIEGAVRYGRVWMIPSDARRPEDRRKSPPGTICRRLMPDARFAILDTLSWQTAAYPYDSLLGQMDAAYRHGEAHAVLNMYHTIPFEDEHKLTAASLAMVAAIISGNYSDYVRIQQDLERMTAQTDDPEEQLAIAYPSLLTAASMNMNSMLPEWLKTGELPSICGATRARMLYLHCLCLRNENRLDALQEAALTAQTLLSQPDTFTWTDIMWPLFCAYVSMRRRDLPAVSRYLEHALSLGMPYGFVYPYADYYGYVGVGMKPLLDQYSKAANDVIQQQWKVSNAGWVAFHNRFAWDNVSAVLSSQEHQAATLLVSGASYREAAGIMHISFGRFKNVISTVYAKLYITNRQDLTKFLLG